MKHNEYIVIGISSTGRVDASDQGTERGRYLMDQFRNNNYLRKMSLPPGCYKFNIVQDGAEIVTTLNSLEGCSPVVQYESRHGNKTTSIQFQMGGSPPNFRWLFPLVICVVLMAVVTAPLWLKL